MKQITLTTVDGLDPRDMLAIKYRLTHPASEFHLEVSGVLAGEVSSCVPIVVFHVDGALVGWACSRVWRDMQTLEQYVDERHRGQCVATTMSNMLIACGILDRSQAVAVFSPATETIARKLWRAAVARYQRQGTEWVPI